MSRLKTAGKFGAGICAVSAIISIAVDKFGDQIRTSSQALEIIGNAEGCRREPYQCPADVLTVGIGSTASSSGKIEKKSYSDEEIAERFVKDIQNVEHCIRREIQQKTLFRRELPQPIFDAVVSITFNVGCTKMRNSKLFYYATTQEYEKVCNEFPKWVYAGGRKLRGLEIRREKERQLCLTGLVKF